MNVDRRTLLIGGGAGVGLVVAYALWPRRIGSDLPLRPGEQGFGSYLKIGRDGRVTVAVPQTETGQGIWTGLPQIVADELGADWESVAVEPAPLTGHYANPLARTEGWLAGLGPLREWRLDHDGAMRITAGSTSVRGFERPLREAAAVARAMLIGAAADRWNIGEDECDTADGFVIAGVRTFGFGDLAEEAADRSPPMRAQLRTSQRGRLIGQSLQRLDAPAKTDGSWRFAGDVRLPGMLFASVRLAPPGGRLGSSAADSVRAVPGVRHVVARDRWVAVVAESWWAAERGMKTADPKFTGVRSGPDLRPHFEQALAEGRGETVFSRGHYDRVTSGSRPLAATYWAAPSQHIGLEPLSATARTTASGVEVWAATQAPALARKLAAAAADGEVLFYPLPAGEPAGRVLEPDAIPIAVELARELRQPVQVQLSQSASQNHDRVSAGALARMTALPGEGGLTAAWEMRVATADGLGSAIHRLAGAGAARLGSTGMDGAVPPYAVPNVRIDGVPVGLPDSPGYMRGSPHREFAFFNESFIDELAHAAGMEPLAFRMSLLGSNPRLARCLQTAAQLAQWDGGGNGSTMGLAGCSAFGSHIGLVAVASIGEDQRIRAHKLVATVDCGTVVNPGLVIQQIEGGLIWALAQATVAAPEWVAGMPRARSVGGIGLPRMSGVPELIVQILPSRAAPGGVSGLGTTVLAPAVANAIYAGTGKRMRNLPFDPGAAA
ncbi:MAG TPA: molybdopterin cofactor-binding domain-containing protein [Sphingomicrobium sp.]|nr:molybdopterin cofactor-binding domain-containing protein [Sphingomicrobium sp.]